MKGMNFFILASGCILAVALASCTSIDEPVPEPSSSPIGFSPAVNDANTRYASDDLPATMGVFAYLHVQPVGDAQRNHMELYPRKVLADERKR